MSSRAAAWWLAVALTVFSIGLALGTLVLLALGGAGSDAELQDVLSSVAITVFALVAAPLGGIIALRRRGHPVGWLLGAASASVGVSQFSNAYAQYGLLNCPSGCGFSGLALWLGNVSWPIIWIPTLLLLLVFPTGSLLSQHWRPVAWAAVVVPALPAVLSALIEGPIHISDTLVSSFDNPTGVPGVSVEFAFQLFVPLFLLELGLLLAAVASLGLQFRRARGVERQQLKWLFYATAVFLGSQLLSVSGLVGRWGQLLANLAGDGVSVAIGLAVLRYRLYEIDRIINRTLVYGVLTVFLALCYWLSVVVLQTVLRPITQGSDLAIVGSTLCVAALFQPLRGRIQHAVDRRFYRQRYDANRTLEAFSSRLREQVDLDSLGVELLSVVGQTMQPRGLSLWLRPPSHRRNG